MRLAATRIPDGRELPARVTIRRPVASNEACRAGSGQADEPDLPDADRSVVSNGEDPPPMRRERNARDRVVVTAQVHELQAEHRVANHRASIALPADEQPSIAAERDGFRKPCTAGDRVIPAIRPPHLGTVRRRSRDETAIGTYRDGAHDVSRIKRRRPPSRSDVPQPHHAVSASGDQQLCTLAEGRGGDNRPELEATADRLRRRGVPHPPPFEVEGDDVPPARAERRCFDEAWGVAAGATKRTQPSAPAHGSRRWSLPSGRRG